MVAFVFSTFEVPGQFAATAASVGGINDFGQIAGTFTDGSGRARIFVRTGSRYDTVLVSQANSGLSVSGLNNLDLVVGSTYSDFDGTLSPGSSETPRALTPRSRTIRCPVASTILATSSA